MKGSYQTTSPESRLFFLNPISIKKCIVFLNWSF